MKHFLISISIHVLIFSFVWVGFSIPIVRQHGSFTYLGGMVLHAEDPSGLDRNYKSGDLTILGEPSAAFFTPWIKMRELDKPH